MGLFYHTSVKALRYNRLPMEKETKNARSIRYVDTLDRAWQEHMQDPETWDQIRRQFLEKELEDWPDQILLAGLPQVPEDQIDAPIVEIIGRCEGKIFNRSDISISTETKQTAFFRPKSTKFVRIVREGMELMERWDADKHGEWETIPDTGLTPSELLERLYGFGETAVEQGQQFNLVRKRNASKTHWKPGHLPGLKRT